MDVTNDVIANSPGFGHKMGYFSHRDTFLFEPVTLVELSSQGQHTGNKRQDLPDDEA